MLIDDRTESEKRIDAALKRLHPRQAERVADALEDDDFVPIPLFRLLVIETALALTPLLASVYTGQAAAMDAEFNGGSDGANLELEGHAWARSYADALAQHVTQSAVARAEEAKRKLLEPVADVPGTAPPVGDIEPTAEADPRKLRKAIDDIFSPDRARSIAYTETTRAASAGGINFTNRLAGLTGQPWRIIWVTQEDERVCWLCNPLDGKDQDTWRIAFPEGPPAHPNCRCSLEYLVPKPAEELTV